MIVYEQHALENSHHLQESFYKCTMENGDDVVAFLWKPLNDNPQVQRIL